jgi:hypothetical protein
MGYGTKRAPFFLGLHIYFDLYPFRHERAVQELDKQYQQALEEKNILAEQLQVTTLSIQFKAINNRLAYFVVNSIIVLVNIETESSQ